ncbi:MAG: hypothetical protein WB493_04765 [Anaeromyxobacteraceae bacterium]
MPSRVGRLLVFAVASWAAIGGEARAEGFFGAETATAWQPELDAYVQVADGVRIQAQVLTYLVPADGAAQLGVGVYASWLLADVLREVLSPDRAKSHALDLRVGVLHDATLAAGELDVEHTWITPFVNAELFWQQAPGMWTQLRLQGGLQVGFDLFARGQAIEASWMAVTRLQPVHSWSPQVGLILSSY